MKIYISLSKKWTNPWFKICEMIWTCEFCNPLHHYSALKNNHSDIKECVLKLFMWWKIYLLSLSY